MAHEFDGRKYEQASDHQKEWGRRLIAELDLRGFERVLDLGCGDSALTSQIADLVPRGEVLGIDASQGMIEAASPKARENLRFQQLDINGLDYVEQFDVVFSNAALHWIKDHRRLLQNVRRSLRAEGRLRFNFAGNQAKRRQMLRGLPTYQSVGDKTASSGAFRTVGATVDRQRDQRSRLQ